MGGCKCSFQDCKSSTALNAGMHFFHFPVRDAERCEKWAHYSNCLAYLQLPVSVLRNKVICEKHFRMECFMNSKKERLTKWAVPTIKELPNGQLINLVKDEKLQTIYDIAGMSGETEKLIILNKNASQKTEIEQINEEYLLNEKSSSAVYENYSKEEYENYENEDNITLDGASLENHEISETVSVKESTKAHPLLLNSKTLKRPNSESIILTKIEMTPQKKKSKIGQNAMEITSTDNLTENESSQIYESIHMSNKNGDDEHEYAEIIFETANPDQQIILPDNEHTEVEINDPIQSNETHESIQNIIQLVTKMQEEQNQNNQRIEQAFQLSNEQRNETNKKIDHFKDINLKICNKLEKIIVPLAQQQQNVPGQKTIYIDRNPTMNKSLLFNGIKKYLNPSMVALLRMEMFGGPERHYKPDEKMLAMELFKLNDAYEYMRDEWRFRLPPKSEVEKWIKEREEQGNQVDWDDC